MSLVFAGITPHGFPLVPELSADAEGAMATRRAMEELGRRFAAARPEVIVIATPHGTRVEGAICLAATARAAGALHWKNKQFELNVPVDMKLTDEITATAQEKGIPIALAGFGGYQRERSIIPLDWAVMIPLRFLSYAQNMVGYGDVFVRPDEPDNGLPVVIAAPSRSLPRSMMVEFGKAVAEAAGQDGRRVAFIASCDWAHRHKADCPFGYHPAAAEVDAIVVEALKVGYPARLIDLPEEMAQNAAIDGLWQTLMLAGALEHMPMRGELLSYEAPTYYGMLVAAFTPEKQ